MKIKSQKLIGQNGKVREHFINYYNSSGLIERIDYVDEKGELKFYSVYSYDSNGNCVLKKEYDSDGIIQSSNEWEFDDQNREIKFLELTSENVIWEWYEKEYPNENTIVFIAKDEKGSIIHKTIENIESKTQERFAENGKLYSSIVEEFDSMNRLIKRKTINTNGDIIEEYKYRYDGLTEIKEFHIDGKFVKTEEYEKDGNGNQVYYVRKDNKGKSLEWLKREFDKYGNQISIENGIETNKPTNKSTIEIEYIKNENAC